MKKITITSILLIMASVFITHCKKADKREWNASNHLVNGAAAEKKFRDAVASYTTHHTAGKAMLSMSVIATPLAFGTTVSGIASPEGIAGVPMDANYYTFSGHAGDVITITVTRTNCAMDPAFSLFFGATNDYSAVTHLDGGTNLQFLEFHDDEVAVPAYCTGTCFNWADPSLQNYVLPYTGTYTLAVCDYQSCSNAGPLSYTLSLNHVKGATIIIDGCDTGVPNATLAGGGTMQDAILALAVGVKNHGAFVSAVAQLTNAWVSAGRITGAEKGAIMHCTGSSSLPN